MQVEKNIERLNSTEINISSKLKFSGKVKCYGVTIEEAFTKATEYAKMLEILIKEKNFGLEVSRNE